MMMEHGWPVYSREGVHPATDSWRLWRTGRGRPGSRGVLGAAIDVWRDGEHLWRSYPASQAVSVDDWTFERHGAEFGTGYPRDFDNGLWHAPGVSLSPDSLVPVAVSWVGGAQEVSQLLATVAAIAQLPADPVDLELVPTGNAIGVALNRAGEHPCVIAFVVDNVAVRALVARVAPPVLDPGQNVRRFRACLVRRAVRTGAGQRALPEGEVVFTVPEDSPPHILVRRAKSALNMTGVPAQRVGDLVWHITGAPYRLAINRLT